MLDLHVLPHFADVPLGRVDQLGEKLLDQTYGDYDQQAIRVVARYDAAPFNSDAVAVLRGVNA